MMSEESSRVPKNSGAPHLAPSLNVFLLLLMKTKPRMPCSWRVDELKLKQLKQLITYKFQWELKSICGYCKERTMNLRQKH